MSRLPTAIANDLVDSYEREYKELCENWLSLERKAQLSGGVVGALLAGVISFIGGQKTAPSTLTTFLIALVSAFLIASAYCSLSGLRVSTETLPPPGEKLRAIAWAERSDEKATWIDNYTVEAANKRVVLWDQACRDLHQSNEIKGGLVRRSQALLLAAGVAATALAGSLLYSAVIHLPHTGA